jgi:hypothetical protein
MAADDLDLATPHTEMLGEQLDHSVVGRSVDRRSRRPHHKPAIALGIDSLTSRPWDYANRNRARRLVHKSPPSSGASSVAHQPYSGSPTRGQHTEAPFCVVAGPSDECRSAARVLCSVVGRLKEATVVNIIERGVKEAAATDCWASDNPVSPSSPEVTGDGAGVLPATTGNRVGESLRWARRERGVRR